MTQADFAKQVGIAPSAISEWKKRKTKRKKQAKEKDSNTNKNNFLFYLELN